MKKAIVSTLLIVLPFLLFGQDCKNYHKKYVPQNLEDALSYLECAWNKAEKDTFRNKDEFAATIQLHHGYGTWIRNHWGLWRGRNPLYKYFKGFGLFHPDDMSDIILVSFHRRLNDKDIKLEEQIQRYKEFWDKAKELEKQK